MKKFRSFLCLAILVLVVSACTKTETRITSLPRSTPEKEGVSAAAILEFIKAAEQSKNELHSFMFLRHGRVIAEGWWNPYRADLKHTMYSTSKSFTSTAAGFAISEGKLSVEDKVISFFRDQLPDTISPFLAELRVKDLLSMSVGQEPDPTFKVVLNDSNWVKSFLTLPIIKKPGTEFLYNTLATYMVAAILQKVTGEKLIDYLRPRLFDPLAIKDMDWEVDPKNINVGGWGLRVKTEDMAKLGQLYLQKGVWNGKQILPESWIEEATSAIIKDSAPYLPIDKKEASDWAQGYGYQFWQCRNNAYRADGAYGQYIIVLPEHDAVVVLTSETADMQDEINLVWKYLLPSFQYKDQITEATAYTQLQEKLTSLALPLPTRSASAIESSISGNSYIIAENKDGYEEVTFGFNDDVCSLSLKKQGQVFSINFGSGAWNYGETSKLGPALIPAKAHFVGLPDPKVAGTYQWKDDNTIELILRYIESPHTEFYTCRFDGKKVSIELRFSNVPERIIETFNGELKK
jgi:CubicO group peptidase (beta-lactamase class C family)